MSEGERAFRVFSVFVGMLDVSKRRGFCGKNRIDVFWFVHKVISVSLACMGIRDAHSLRTVTKAFRVYH